MARTKIRVKLNRAGVIGLLKSAEVSDDLTARGERIAAAAGGAPDFEVETGTFRDRARVIVKTATTDGARAEAENRALSRAIDAGR